MGLTVLDAVLPTRRRLRAFLRGPGFPYAWMAPIGFGWARAQMRRRPRRPQPLVDPLLDWFAIDGAGFHDGFFHPQRLIEERRVPRGLHRTAGAMYDQGIGRSLWFVRGADVERIEQTIASFPVARRRDLWSGAASAATYAGGVDGDALATLRDSSQEYRTDVAQGAAFAIKARLAGGNATPHTALAAEVFCGMPALEAARCTDAALEGIAVAGHDSPYDAWRSRVKAMLAEAVPLPDPGSRPARVAEGACG
jgi:enediyne biosynthesis protein E3